MGCLEWITPFKKQCFVTAGVAINVSQFAIVMAFSAILLPQLRKSDSIIQIDDNSGSWIAAIPSFTLVVGNLSVPTIMAKYGRKIANLISIVPLIIGWLTVSLSNTISLLYVARLLQGISMGMSTSLGPILIGEYTSPKNRGSFLSTITFAMSFGTLLVHTLGSYLSWQGTALICTFLTLADLLILIFSPESPSWLADRGKYEDCKRVFLWLGGDNEEEELNKMIEASQVLKESQQEEVTSERFIQKMNRNFRYFVRTIQLKEFHKPIFITIHMYIIAHWGGINLLSAYTLDVFHRIIGYGYNDPLLVITMDVQRIFSSILAVVIIRKFKRRTMLFITLGITIFAYLATAGYTYARHLGYVVYDHPAIGIALIHIHIFAVVTGSLPLPMVIAGEIFPSKYRSIAGGISAVFYSLNCFVTVKTVPVLLKKIDIHGTYLVYAGVIMYCTLIAWYFLPETKDKTLSDIEKEFRGKPLILEDLQSAIPLNTWKEEEKVVPKT